MFYPLSFDDRPTSEEIRSAMGFANVLDSGLCICFFLSAGNWGLEDGEGEGLPNNCQEKSVTNFSKA